MTRNTGSGSNTLRLAARLVVALLAATTSLALPTAAGAQASCTFQLGFATLRGMVGADTVGNCLRNEAFNPGNGNAEQPTVRGLMVWRKRDNWTAFTDGHRTWINGPGGLAQRLNTQRFAWEGDAGTPGTTLVAASASTATAPAVSPLTMFVPCSDLGQRYYDTGSSNPNPRQFFYDCNSPLYPRLSQNITQNDTAADAQGSLARSGNYVFTASEGWYEIPSPGPSGLGRSSARQREEILR